MEKKSLLRYKDVITDSLDIVNDVILKTQYPSIIMTRDFKIIFVNEHALRLYNTTFEETFMKNYLGIYCKNEDEYDNFLGFYQRLFKDKKPIYVSDIHDNSHIMIFPILSKVTGEVEYIHNIYDVEEFHLVERQNKNPIFNYDYDYFTHQLSVLLDAKDKYTANHSTNVTKYSMSLGKAIGLSTKDLHILRLAANLHDVGKISIPNYILNKEGLLDHSEFEHIKKHSLYSYDILKVFKNLDGIAESALHHHERYDGTGYPFGIKGKDIPLNSRIICIADAFDAMTSDRPYGKTMSINEAILELKENKGTQFDPFLVDKFINLDLQMLMSSLSEFDSSFSDEYSIPDNALPIFVENLNHMFKNVDSFDILENLIAYNFYGCIIAKDSDNPSSCTENGFQVVYQSGLVDEMYNNKFLWGNWELCLKEKQFASCNQCPVDSCIKKHSAFFKKAKLTNIDGDVKYLNTMLHPLYDSKTNETYIFELFRDETLNVKFNSLATSEFFSFTSNLSNIFAEQNRDYSIINRELKGLCNWIADKVGVSEHKKELLNKALSICDLGIIGLIDSNEHSFESINKLRTNNKHISIIYNMITKLKSFDDIRDIILYHHTYYNDTSNKLSGDEIPIQSYIISISDYLLTYIVMGETIEYTLNFLESVVGVFASPKVCNAILHDDAKNELILILEKILENN